MRGGPWRVGRGGAVLIVVGYLLGCATRPTYGPAFPLIPSWDNSPLVPVTPPPPELIPQVPPKASSPFAGILPPPEEWESWKPAHAKTVCSKPRKGQRRVCRDQHPSIPEQALEGALIRATLRQTAGSNSAMVRYTLDSNTHLKKIYEVICAVKSPCQLWLPPEEQLTSPLLLDTSDTDAKTWDVGEVGVAGPRGARQQVLGLRPRSVMDPTFVTLVFQSGLAYMIKLVSVEDGGMLAVSWTAPPRLTPVPLPLEDRPPKLRLDQLFSQYHVKVKDQLVPPWMPRSVLDDGRLTLIQLPSLEGLRGPAVFGLNQQAEVRLTQFRLFAPPNPSPEAGVWLVLQGIWPAIKVLDADGLEVIVERGNARPPVLGGPRHGM